VGPPWRIKGYCIHKKRSHPHHHHITLLWLWNKNDTFDSSWRLPFILSQSTVSLSLLLVFTFTYRQKQEPTYVYSMYSDSLDLFYFGGEFIYICVWWKYWCMKFNFMKKVFLFLFLCGMFSIFEFKLEFIWLISSWFDVTTLRVILDDFLWM